MTVRSQPGESRALSGRARSFEERGYFGPVSLFEPDECRTIARRLAAEPPPPVWEKGHAAASYAYYAIGRLPRVVDLVSDLLGPDVMLWGCSLVRRGPDQVHPWHTDIETHADERGTVSVWIGLENVDRRSALSVISRSHRFGATIQERARNVGASRSERTTENVLAWAREIDPEGELVEFDMGDGDAVLFDGRLWHGTHNTSTAERTALLLQYADPERRIDVPDLTHLEFPFRYEEGKRAPCVMVRGEARGSANHFVSPPELGMSWVGRLRLPLEEDERTGWNPHRIHAGPTPCVDHLTCHASVLSPGNTPHEPHAHAEEEILVMLDGEAELVLVDEGGTRRTETVRRGAFAYYPEGQLHTIRNASDGPATYLMFKWRNGEPEEEPGAVLSTRIVRFDEKESSSDSRKSGGWATRHLLRGRTRHLHGLTAHRTVMAAGGGYAPHVDPYDVGIVLLSGTVETLDRRLEPHDVVFYAAGEPHGMRNPGDEPASYLVFEFHGDRLTFRRNHGLLGRLRSEVARRLPARMKPGLTRVLRALAG